MHDIFLIRHSITEGNLKKRYIGMTDEPLCKEGILLLKQIKELRKPQDVECLYVSPLKRCIETAKWLYPDLPFTVEDELRECDFGHFENKNYQELEGDIEYQTWIDSNGVLPFPGGEDPKAFKQRSVRAFLKIVKEEKKEQIAFVVHGGTIMSIMEAFIQPSKSFYDWYVKNGCGYHLKEKDGIFSLYEKIE